MLGKVKMKWRKLKVFNDETGHYGGIYSPSQFEEIVKHERVRTDRNGSGFSLVIYPLKSEEELLKAQKKWIPGLKKHIREIDSIGWIQKKSLAVLLPQTGYNGAIHFCDHIRQEGIEHQSEIITYPPEKDNRDVEIVKDNREDKGRLASELISEFAPSIPYWKVTLDKTGAIFALILFSPLFILLPLYIKLVSPGPVFYHQIRIGYRGRRFKFWKFRTMHIGEGTTSHNNHLKDLIHSDKPMTKLDDKKDNRIIPGGRIIRKCCLDEVPQFLNILTGSMSLVGPRPCIPYEAKEYLIWHKYRFDIYPGLTGLWQVSGKNKLTFKEMIRLDLAYSKRMSLGLDLWIMFSTFPAIIKMVGEAAFGKTLMSAENNIK